jgi:hypothetical protein
MPASGLDREMLSSLGAGAMGTSGGRVREGRASGFLEFGRIGTDGGRISGSGAAGAALGRAGDAAPGRVSVGLVFLGVVVGTAQSGSAGAGLGVADGIGFLGVSRPFPLGVERGSASFGNTSGGNPPGSSTVGICGFAG